MKTLQFFRTLGEEMKKAVMKTNVAKSVVKGKSSKKAKKPAAKIEAPKSLNKKYLKSAPVCKVTFRLPREAAPDASSVSVVGDFNNWSITENEMTRLKNGDFKVTLDLPCNREYKFRYLIDSDRWENDWFADKYIPNGHGSDDSVVVVNGTGK